MGPTELRSEEQLGRLRRPGQLVSTDDLLVWLICGGIILLVEWGIYALVLRLYNFNLFGGPHVSGGRLNGIRWAGLVGLVCLLPAAVFVIWRRRMLGLMLLGFALVYALGLAAFWGLSGAIWGPVGYAYSAADAGETACWKQVRELSDLSDTEVQGLAGVSATDVWAVGQDFDHEQSLTVHWDGKTLRRIASPGTAELVAVSAVSPTNVWAAGGATVEHWNGSAWQLVSTPRLPKLRLDGIAAHAGNAVWVVGSFSKRGTLHPLIGHWDGNGWRVVLGEGLSGYLTAIATRSVNDVWAVGQARGRTLIEHWDGRGWRRRGGANAEMRGKLNDVAALSASNAWAVGTSAGKALIQHWDGGGWRVVRSVNAGKTSSLHDISALSARDIWAAGEREDISAPLLEHWNGSRWRAAPVPHLSHVGGFSALAVFSPTQIWGDVNEPGGFLSSDVPFIERSSCSA
jgi:hypothetical protein